MRILVHGAGALGAYFGGRLLEAGYDVSYFVRERRAEQLQQEGLRIHSPQGDFTHNDIQVYTNPEKVENIDLVIVAVKGYHLDQAIPQVKTIAQSTGAFVLPILNGIEHVERLQEAVGQEKVIGGFASIIATLNEEGHVVHTSGNSGVKFGPLHSGQEEICQQLAQAQPKVKTNYLLEEDILKSMWKKYIFITAFSGITTAMQLPAGFIASTDASFHTARHVIYEMASIAEKEDISLTEMEVEQMAMNLRGFSPEATSSMHQDFRKGLPLEVEHLHGGALRMAGKYDMRLPVIETLYGVIKPYEQGNPLR